MTEREKRIFQKKLIWYKRKVIKATLDGFTLWIKIMGGVMLLLVVVIMGIMLIKGHKPLFDALVSSFARIALMCYLVVQIKNVFTGIYKSDVRAILKGDARIFVGIIFCIAIKGILAQPAIEPIVVFVCILICASIFGIICGARVIIKNCLIPALKKEKKSEDSKTSNTVG